MMSKQSSFFFLVLALAFGFSAFSGTTEKNNALKKIELTVAVEGDCPLDTLRLFAWRNVQIEEAYIAVFDKASSQFIFELERLPEGVYYLGTSLQNTKMCYLGTEKKLQYKGSCQNIAELQVEQSKVNKELEESIAFLQAANTEFMQLLQKNSQAQASELSALKKEFAQLDQRKKEQLESLRKSKSPVFRLLALNNYQSFQNNAAPGQNEANYIAEHYFDEVDFRDSLYSKTPFFFEGIKNYSATISKVGLSFAQQKEYLDAFWGKIDAKHPNHMPLALGLCLGLMANNADLFLIYSELFLETYSGKNALLDQFLQEQINRLRGPLPLLKEAPNLEGLSPEGKNMSLRDMRGKVVLVDFWASWCGPCRKENPHVVKLYEKYKDKGFEILGVSLDTDKNRWIAAIAQDKLTWPQMSELKGWQASHAKLYGVSSIPFTVLLDAEGKVLAKQLRGAALDQKLKEVFGF